MDVNMTDPKELLLQVLRDKDAVRFLDTLNADWRTTNDTDLAGQFGLLMQGSYDMRRLIVLILDTKLYP